MNTPELFSMQSKDDAVDLGVVFSPSPQTLRVFGASYMLDQETTGTLKILDPHGAIYATFDVWQSKWILATEEEARPSIFAGKLLGWLRKEVGLCVSKTACFH